MSTETVSNTLAVEEAKEVTAQAAVETISLEEAKKMRQENQSLRRRMHEFEIKAKAEEELKD